MSTVTIQGIAIAVIAAVIGMGIAIAQIGTPDGTVTVVAQDPHWG